jgi:transposase-like protein
VTTLRQQRRDVLDYLTAACTAVIRKDPAPSLLPLPSPPHHCAVDFSPRGAVTNKIHKTAIAIRQCKYLNDIVEQDHRAVKRIVRPMLGFKSFWAACCTIAGIEVMHTIRKGQLLTPETPYQTPAEQFYALAA